MVDAKGVDPDVVLRLAQLFKHLGLIHFVCRSDKEPTTRAMMEQATIASGRSCKAYEHVGDDNKPNAFCDERTRRR